MARACCSLYTAAAPAQPTLHPIHPPPHPHTQPHPGKSLLYTAAAGVPPHQILPVCLDVGTNTPSLLEDPGYKGLRSKRVVGADYDAIVEEFVAALQAWRPHVLLQFEASADVFLAGWGLRA